MQYTRDPYSTLSQVWVDLQHNRRSTIEVQSGCPPPPRDPNTEMCKSNKPNDAIPLTHLTDRNTSFYV